AKDSAGQRHVRGTARNRNGTSLLSQSPPRRTGRSGRPRVARYRVPPRLAKAPNPSPLPGSTTTASTPTSLAFETRLLSPNPPETKTTTTTVGSQLRSPAAAADFSPRTGGAAGAAEMASSMRRRPSRGGGGPGAAAENWERLVRA
uniref:Uncharacterized protein n=1 Tax=Aegilops tauschii subsp. strangulata TaxID=200361 RepID=A0A453QDA6_AEGTS